MHVVWRLLLSTPPLWGRGKQCSFIEDLKYGGQVSGRHSRGRCMCMYARACVRACMCMCACACACACVRVHVHVCVCVCVCMCMCIGLGTTSGRTAFPEPHGSVAPPAPLSVSPQTDIRLPSPTRRPRMPPSPPHSSPLPCPPQLSTLQVYLGHHRKRAPSPPPRMVAARCQHPPRAPKASSSPEAPTVPYLGLIWARPTGHCGW